VSGLASLRLSKGLPYLAACLLTLPFVLPALWALMASLSTNSEITLSALRPPSRLHFENYAYVWTEGDIGRFVGNSLVVSVASAILVALGATLLGYALGRLEFPGRRLVLIVVFAAIALPVFAYLIPLTRTVRALNLPDARMAVILATTATFLPVPTLLMRSFFQTLPEELADAARVEGASE
jgi:ABC-type glycerol-3-phosphate transport system permease component